MDEITTIESKTKPLPPMAQWFMGVYQLSGGLWVNHMMSRDKLEIETALRCVTDVTDAKIVRVILPM